MADDDRRSSRGGCGYGCALAMVIMMGAGVLATIGLVAYYAVSHGTESLFGHVQTEVESKWGEDEMPRMKEVWSAGDGETKVVRVVVDGLISLDDSSPFKNSTAATALRAIRRATHDDNIKGIILDVNSPGGGITDADIIYKALKDFKAADKDGKRKVVTIMNDLAASGGYYIAVASDVIIAHPTTITGSIGVIMQSFNIKQLSEKIGLTDVTIKSGANKDMLNPFKETNPEQVALLQGCIDSMYDRFITLVAENRKLDKEVVRKLADGRVYTAAQAVENKLIDKIGYIEDAKKEMCDQLKEKDIFVIRYEEEPSLSDLFTKGGLGIGLSSELKRMMGNSSAPRLMYKTEF